MRGPFRFVATDRHVRSTTFLLQQRTFAVAIIRPIACLVIVVIVLIIPIVVIVVIVMPSVGGLLHKSQILHLSGKSYLYAATAAARVATGAA